MKRAVIFINGESPKKERVLKSIKKSDFIVCADGGTRHASAFGLRPDVIIGDQDSITESLVSKFTKRGVKFENHPVDKDQTDSELAISYAMDHGFSELLIVGMTGDRVDHMLGTFFFLSHHTDILQIKIITDTQDIYVLKDNDLKLRGKKGDYVSLIPMTDSKNKVTTKGLVYSLYNDTLPFGKTLGVSNELLSSKATISVWKGTLLVIHTLL